MLERDFNGINSNQEQTTYDYRVTHSTEDTRSQKSGEEEKEVRKILEVLAKIGKQDNRPEDSTSKSTENGKVGNFWEPFLSEPTPDERFINLYGGNFAQQMELARGKVEELIRIAGLDGKIVLTELTSERKRQISGVTSEGAIMGKKGLFFGEKLDEDEKQFFQVLPTPSGWKIEISGQEILEQLMSKTSKRPLERRFVAIFNQSLRIALAQVIVNEKLSVKDGKIRLKYIHEALRVVLWGGFTTIVGLEFLPYAATMYVFSNGIWNSFDKLQHRPTRTLNSLLDYLMPSIEIDRVIRGLLYLNLKGRNLVKLQK